MIAHAMAELAAADPDMERALAHSGLPPLRPSEPGFRTLVNAICSQQVSKASAAAILGRLEEAIHPFSPARVMDFDEDSLRTTEKILLELVRNDSDRHVQTDIGLHL